MMKVALAIALAGCGRLGFDELVDDDSPDTDMITLVVRDYALDPQSRGPPVPGATVLVDRGSGFERFVTDDQGIVQVPAPGVVALHAAFRFGPFWQIYTIVAPPSGVIELGNRNVSTRDQRMIFTLPDTGVRGFDNAFRIEIPQSCAGQLWSMTPTLDIDYGSVCEGKAMRAIAYSWLPDGSKETYLDIGDVTLANGSTKEVSGMYAPVPSFDVEVSHVPEPIIQSGGWFDAALLARSDLGFTQLSTGHTVPHDMGDTTILSVVAAPGGNTLKVEMIDFAHSSWSMRIAPVNAELPMTFDARTLLTPFESLVLGHPTSVAWTGGTGEGTLISVSARSGLVSWNAYVPPSVTAVSFPELPDDLAVPVLSSFEATVLRLDIEGMTTAELVRTVDHMLVSESDDFTLFPVGDHGQAFIQGESEPPAVGDAF
jgi:hypothetical protein